MNGRDGSSERHKECNGDKVRPGSNGRRAVLFVSFALVLAAFLGAGISGAGENPDQTLGVGTGSPEFVDMLGVCVIEIGDVDTSNFQFALEGGFIYKIELRGGAGAAGGSTVSHTGGAGGAGAVITLWLDLRSDTSLDYYFTYEYSDKAVGGTGTNTGKAGGAGGAAVFVWDENDNLMAVAAGGAGGGGANNMANGTPGASAVDMEFIMGEDFLLAYNGENAYNTNAGGGGAGGGGLNDAYVFIGGTGGAAGVNNGAGKGGKGGFSFVDSGPYAFEVSNTGAAGISVLKYEAVEEYYVSGTVMDSQGDGISGALVWYYIDQDEGTIETDSNGYYEIEAFGNQTVTIIDVTLEGYEVVTEMPEDPFTKDSEVLNGIDFVMLLVEPVTVTVKNNGSDLAGVSITYTVYKEDGETVYSEGTGTTGANGKYSIHALEGYTVVISDISKNGFRLDLNVTLPVNCPAGSDVGFTMDAAATLKITVTNSNGTVGLTGATIKYKVTVNGVTGTEVTKVTNGNGEYIITGLFGGDTVEITSVTFPGYKLADVTKLRSYEAGDTPTFAMLKDMVISGTVTYSNGTAVASFQIRYTVNGGAVTTVNCTGGAYSITASEGQTVAVTVVLSGYKVEGQDPKTFTTATQTGNFRMLKVFEITGTVMCGDEPLKDVTVSYKVNGGAVKTVKTDENGVYMISGLIEGDTVEITGVELKGYTLTGELPGARGVGSDAVNFVMEKNAGSSSNLVWYILIVLAIVVIAVLLYFFFFQRRLS